MTKREAPRYRVGCAGMFILGMDSGYRDEDEAIIACLHGPVGCEVLDTHTGKWIGPTCMEEIEDAQARVRARSQNESAGKCRAAEKPKC